jgi:hypothetical protein
VARMRWFIAGAVTAAGALVAAGQVRRMLGAGDADELEPWDEPSPYEPASYDPPAATPRPATAFAAYDAPPPVDDDTQELRLRIDETRDRIRRRTQDVAGSESEPDEAG